jgi:ABC-type glycerol-3-phosphate transport system substrate-binding protein
MFLKKIAMAGAFSLMASASYAACDISSRVSIVGNEFPAIQTVGKGAQECAGGEVKANLTADHQKINLAGMQGNPAEYTSAIIANSSIVALMNEDVIRPLDDLLAKHGDGLKQNQLITIDGKVMAVAFMANAQHLVYRKDILEEAMGDIMKWLGEGKLTPPPATTYKLANVADAHRDIESGNTVGKLVLVP